MVPGNKCVFFLSVCSDALSIGHRDVEDKHSSFPACPHASISILRELAFFHHPLTSPHGADVPVHNCACIRSFLIVALQCNMMIELPSRAMLQRAKNLGGDG